MTRAQGRDAVAAIALSAALSALLLAPASAPAASDDDEVDAGSGPQRPASPWHGRVELKRQNTSRGTPDESSKTTLRLESLFTGPVRLLRLDLQFPDEKTGFGGDPFNPRPGDTKFRLGFRPLEAAPYTFPSFVEVSFPTADPQSLGSGKVQVSAGIRLLAPLTLPIADPKPHEARFEAELEHVQSVAGDENRADVRYTKLELTFYDVWRSAYTFKLKLKPSVDWAKDGQTGAVGEVEGGLFFAGHWRTWLMLGSRLWGPDGTGGTYDVRVELGLTRTF